MTRREGTQAELLSALQQARLQLLAPRPSGEDLDTEAANREDRVELTPRTTVPPHAFSAAWVPRPPAEPPKTFGCLSRWPVTAGLVLSMAVLVSTVQVWSSLHKPARADNPHIAGEIAPAPAAGPLTEPVSPAAVPVEIPPPDETVAVRSADARVVAPETAVPHNPVRSSRPQMRPQRNAGPVTRKRDHPHKKNLVHKENPVHKEKAEKRKAQKSPHKHHSVKVWP